MWDIISAIATIPILPFIIVFIGYEIFIKDRKRAIRMAMDVSTIFFILNVGALFNQLFHIGFGIYGILLVMIIGAGLLGNIHYRKSGNIPWKRIVRVIWRVTFFIMVLLYLILNIYVLLKLAFTV
ncbi:MULTISPECIES: DUF3397 domain-containing protein [Paenibacillus]|uniref:DUF3397 domain-containing protein n=1 Tax=Paenibacillus TaxID=44249 RepID=UPI00203CFD85|nr:DUF3397 domain-containing protein [Paenibacillus camelliae]MCM3632251.1 DUF3397 domain-containing protein [Paenibacillus camelliae]